jgi:hypothetical protein
MVLGEDGCRFPSLAACLASGLGGFLDTVLMGKSITAGAQELSRPANQGPERPTPPAVNRIKFRELRHETGYP